MVYTVWKRHGVKPIAIGTVTADNQVQADTKARMVFRSHEVWARPQEREAQSA